MKDLKFMQKQLTIVLLIILGMYPYTATLQALNHMQRRVGGCGGAICIDLKGNVDICHTTDNMSWAIVDGRKKTGEMVQVRLVLKTIFC